MRYFKLSRSLSGVQSLYFHRGFSLVELMVALAIGLLMVTALATVYSNTHRVNTEMAKAGEQIENGRFAIQILESDLAHAGFWGGYVPSYDNLVSDSIPSDAPTAIPDPCLPYNTTNWNSAYINNLIAVSVHAYASAPSGCNNTTTPLPNQKANTDILVVRYTENCVPGTSNCETDQAGRLYFQTSLCIGTAQAATPNSLTLAPVASSTANFYTGKIIRITGGTGKGQSRVVTAYDENSKTITISTNWANTPDTTSIYTFGATDYVLDTTASSDMLTGICTAVVSKRRYISNIYYVRDYSQTVGDGIPALVRAKFDVSGGVLKHQTPEVLVEGIEVFRVQFGVDSLSDSVATVGAAEYSQAVSWADASTRLSPTNRGDGIPDETCDTNTGTACTLDQYLNVVHVKLFILSRSTEMSPGWADDKTYTLAGATYGPFNDAFKRHAFTSSVRINNVAGRRETP